LLGKGEREKGKGDWESVRQGGDDWTKSGVRKSVRQGRSHRWGEGGRLVGWELGKKRDCDFVRQG